MSLTQSPIMLIVGLSNPGKDYALTRHNAGAWFIELLAKQYKVSLKNESKFKGLYGAFNEGGNRCHLLIPTTFMNLSGQAIKAIADFYKIDPAQILIAHDELDLAPGDTRLKFGGGHGGHNGLRDTISHLHSQNFLRLRIGIGHPGASQKHLVADYVLNRPPHSEYDLILASLYEAASIVPYLFEGEIEKAMQQLHTK